MKMPPYVVLRGKKYGFRIRIPKAARHRYPNEAGTGFRTHIWEALNTSSDNEAFVLGAAKYVEWTAKFAEAHDDADNMDRRRADDIALTLTGRAFQSVGSIRQTPSVSEKIAHLDAIITAFKNVPGMNDTELRVIAGDIDTPALSWEALLERFMELKKHEFVHLPRRTYYKKANPFKAYIKNFRTTLPDAPADVLKLKPKHAYDYAAALEMCVAKGEMEPNTASKKVQGLKQIFKIVLPADHPDHQNPFTGTNIKNAAKCKPRDQFEEEDLLPVRKELAASRLDKQLVDMCIVMEQTGTSVQELTLMSENDIHLDVPIPYIRIADNEHRKQVKSGGARHRDIPLLPDAEAAMRRNPRGFTRYRRDGGNDSASYAMNKVIKRAAPGKTSAGYRHRFSYLMFNSKCQDTLKNAIMGHTTKNLGQSTHYGKGYTLESKLEAMKKALEPNIETENINQTELQHDMT